MPYLRGGIKVSDTDIAKNARDAGFTGDSLITAIAVALAESGGYADAFKDDNIESSYGLWQVNLDVHPYTIDQMVTPSIAARAAYSISSGGTNWQPWSTFKLGMHNQYLDRARAAANGESLPDGPEPWTTVVIDLWNNIKSLRDKQATSTEPGFPMNNKDFVAKLVELIDTAVIKLQQLKAPDTVVQYWQGQSESLKHSPGIKETNTILDGIADWVKKNVENIVDNLPNPTGWIKDVIDNIGTIGGTAVVFVIGAGMVLIGILGLIGSTPVGPPLGDAIQAIPQARAARAASKVVS